LQRLFVALGFADDSIASMSDRRWWKRAEALNELLLMRTRKGVSEIARLLSDQRNEVRLLALESIMEIDGMSSFPVLAGKIARMTPWNEINLARVILRHKKEAGRYLLPVLRHTDLRVRLFAIKMVGIVGCVEAVPPLMEIAKSFRALESREAISALARIGDERAMETFYWALSSADAGTRISAAGALGKYGNAAAVKYLVPMLDDEVGEVRFAAAQAMSKCEDEGVTSLIAVAASDRGAPSLAASHALDDLALHSSTPIVAGDF